MSARNRPSRGPSPVSSTDDQGLQYGRGARLQGDQYTCTATNDSGTAHHSVTIKVDTVPPQVTVVVPAEGETYALNAVVPASYSCLDATSAVASCAGSVKDGAAINTSSAGTKTFKVAGKDKAGNKKTVSVLYSVQ